MLQLDYCIVCESIIVDVETNAPTLVRVLEAITTPGLPCLIPQLAIVSLWKVSDADFDQDQQVGVTIKPPGLDDKPQTVHANFRPSKGSRRHRVLTRLNGLFVTGFGEVLFTLTLNGQEVGRQTLEIEKGDDSALAIMVKMPSSAAAPSPS